MNSYMDTLNSSLRIGTIIWITERTAYSDGSVVYTNPGSKAASVSSINKAKEIHDFITSNGKF